MQLKEFIVHFEHYWFSVGLFSDNLGSQHAGFGPGVDATGAGDRSHARRLNTKGCVLWL